MKKVKILLFILSLTLFGLNSSLAQFNIDSYKSFLEQNKNLSSQQLLDLHSAGLFSKSADVYPNSAAYFDSVKLKYSLTEDEIDLIKKNGFVVSERLKLGSFGEQFEDIYHKDLPVYISSDAILHAFHMSYDKILKETELRILIDKLNELLLNLKTNFPSVASRVSTQANLEDALHDFDVYLTVAQSLLKGTSDPYYENNVNLINTIIEEIYSEQFVERPLFSGTARKIDFSQFKPRGHYVDDYHPELANYFRTMMWFGRIELYLIAPKSITEVPIEDVQRQIMMSMIFSELIKESNQRALFDEIEHIIKTFVGEQDNVTLPNLEEVINETNITTFDQLLDTSVVREFQEVLKTKSYAGQKILSQILIKDPFSPDKIEPSSSFMPFGQRFVIDSYVTGSVVFDKVEYPGFPLRMLPSTLDILFALGNDAAAQLLQSELDTFNYSAELAALRYLIDSHNNEFWDASIYNLWLNSIRSLNPSDERSTLPDFMQTAAWWQQKMNSQLSAWTELRHDNLLYAKQSYSGGATCSYPYSYVEPVPRFFESINKLALNTLSKLNSISSFDEWTMNSFNSYFNNLAGIADTLAEIAQKELDMVKFSSSDENFLRRMLFNNPDQICGAPNHIGWYPTLYYNDFEQSEMHKEDYIVADYHTAPTDEAGNFVGWVKHAGTGPIDLAIIVTKNSENKIITFVGPVSSYYEYTSTNFFRLNDDEWKETYLVKEGGRPNWTNIYLIDNQGKAKTAGLQLLTDVKQTGNVNHIPEYHIIAQNYPNPFNPSTIIQYTIPQALSNSKTILTVYNLQGEVIEELLNKQLPAGTYMTRWNGTNQFEEKVSTGIYFYEIKVGQARFVGKMNLLK